MEHPVEFAALIGIDWSDTKHDVCLVETQTGAQERSVISHTPEALNEWASALRSRFGGAQVAICLEQSRGPLIYALLKYDFLILYPVNPKTLARFREAFAPSRAKDDPQDAEYLVELLIHHRERLKAWLPDDEKTRTLQLLVEHRRRLVGDQNQQSADGTPERLLSSSIAMVPRHPHSDGVRVSAALAEPRGAQRRAAGDP